MGRGKNVFRQHKKSGGCVLCRGGEVGIVPKEQIFNVFNVTRGKKGKTFVRRRMSGEWLGLSFTAVFPRPRGILEGLSLLRSALCSQIVYFFPLLCLHPPGSTFCLFFFSPSPPFKCRASGREKVCIPYLMHNE